MGFYGRCTEIEDRELGDRAPTQSEREGSLVGEIFVKNISLVQDFLYNEAVKIYQMEYI
jgi:hypothetical protein